MSNINPYHMPKTLSEIKDEIAKEKNTTWQELEDDLIEEFLLELLLNKYKELYEKTAAQFKREWIKCSERLPEDKDFLVGQTGDVLCMLDDGTVIMGNYSANVWRIYWSGGRATLVGSNRNITHWQPLPSTPTNEQRNMGNEEIITQIESGKTTRKDIAVMYESLFKHAAAGEDFWRPINEAIIKRWSESGLTFIKEFAWKINEKNNSTPTH